MLFYLYLYIIYTLFTVHFKYKADLEIHRNLSYLSRFLYFWLHWVFVALCRLSLVVMSKGDSSLQGGDFSLRWLLLLQSLGPRVCGLQ